MNTRFLGVLFSAWLCRAALAECAASNRRCLWDEFKAKFGRIYSANEESRRFAVFSENLEEMARLNAEMPSAHFAINQFSDLSPMEFRNGFLSTVDTSKLEQRKARAKGLNRIAPKSVTSLPVNFTSSFVTPAKDQKTCGACWAFAAISVVESQWKKITGITEDFSEQQALDCTSGNDCDGGWVDEALGTLSVWPSVLESNYPYVSRKQSCKTSSIGLAHVANVYNIEYMDESDGGNMQQDLFVHGPFAIAMNANTLHHYSSGILPNSQACDDDLNHAAMIYGWGVESNTKFWTIKNSWGPDWGESGSFRLVRNKNACDLTYMMTTAADLSLENVECLQDSNCSNGNVVMTCSKYTCQCLFGFEDSTRTTFTWNTTNTDVLISEDNYIRFANGSSLSQACNGNKLEYLDDEGNWAQNYTGTDRVQHLTIDNIYANGFSLYARTLQAYQMNLPNFLEGRNLRLTITCNNGVTSCLPFKIDTH